MRQIPKNKIKENQYTNGTGIGNNLSLRFSISKVPYVGFYNIVNGNKFFTCCSAFLILCDDCISCTSQVNISI
jgi:hypothetical protein